MPNPTKIKIGELKSDAGLIKNLEISIGRLEVEEEWEPIGRTPFPSISTFRNWDFKLLNRYKPFYAPTCDLCCFCTYGKCDLSKGKSGACGIDIKTQQARTVLLTCCIGASAHTGHGKHMLEHLMEKYGSNYPLDLGTGITIEAPLIRTVCGIKPRTLNDLVDVLNWCTDQITHCLSAVNTGQEASYLDFESKAMHVGMVDLVAMEAADISQVVAFKFQKGDPEVPLVEIGMGTIDRTKPVILCIGHNVSSGIEVLDYVWENGLEDTIDICGICCTAIDLTRYIKPKRAKIVGPLSHQLRFVRSGIADVIIIDEQCVRTDIFQEAQAKQTRVIATNDKISLGLPDRTSDKTDDIVEDLLKGQKGVLILDPKKVGEVAVRVAQKIAPEREKIKSSTMTLQELLNYAKNCTGCGECMRVCPAGLKITEAIQEVAKLLKDSSEESIKNSLTKLIYLYEKCVGCGKCEDACSEKIPLNSLMFKAWEKELSKEKFKVRAGRGPIGDVEIRNVGGPIVLGDIPGIIAYVGCPNYSNGYNEVGRMAEEFLKRRYIVVTTGCSTMDIARYKTESGKSLFEEYPGSFDAGGISNIGSCVSNSWIAGAAVKVASIFAKRQLRANFEEIADYITNRVGACGVAWGAYSQKAASIATGFNRFGVPVILGSQGSKYRRMLLGRKDCDEDWYVYDARTGNKSYIGPAFEHLVYVAESMEECIVMTAKLCVRPNDTSKGRSIKLSHYIDLHKKYFGSFPDDIPLLIRTKADIPLTMKDEISKMLEESSWKEQSIPDPTLIERLIRKKKD